MGHLIFTAIVIYATWQVIVSATKAADKRRSQRNLSEDCAKSWREEYKDRFIFK